LTMRRKLMRNAENDDEREQREVERFVFGFHGKKSKNAKKF
jgi:hypothetical protein